MVLRAVVSIWRMCVCTHIYILQQSEKTIFQRRSGAAAAAAAAAAAVAGGAENLPRGFVREVFLLLLSANDSQTRKIGIFNSSEFCNAITPRIV